MAKKVALDDGHGMETAGKRSPIFPGGSGLQSETGDFMHENEFNRAVVAKAKEHLERCGVQVILTASGDQDTPLKARCAVANNAGVDIFISVHANAMTGAWCNYKGIETLYHPRSLTSKRLASILQRHLLDETEMVDRGLQPRDDLYVLNGTNMPAALVECGFMDNLHDVQLLLSDSYRDECAQEIAAGACEYLGVSYIPAERPQETEPAQPTIYLINISVNGKLLDVQGINRNGSAYVPIRAVSDAVDATCGWDSDCGRGVVNSQMIDHSFISEGRGFGWSREVAAAAGLQFEWDGPNNTIKLFC